MHIYQAPTALTSCQQWHHVILQHKIGRSLGLITSVETHCERHAGREVALIWWLLDDNWKAAYMIFLSLGQQIG